MLAAIRHPNVMHFYGAGSTSYISGSLVVTHYKYRGGLLPARGRRAGGHPPPQRHALLWCGVNIIYIRFTGGDSLQTPRRPPSCTRSPRWRPSVGVRGRPLWPLPARVAALVCARSCAPALLWPAWGCCRHTCTKWGKQRRHHGEQGRSAGASSKGRGVLVPGCAGACLQPPEHCWLLCELLPGGTLSRWLHGDRAQGGR